MEITIFIPCYNSGDKLIHTFEKINQVLTCENIKYECIINDDASTDKTKEVISSIIHKYNKNKIYHDVNDVNEGIGISIKKAVDISTGDYFMWVPGDDDISLDAIRKMVLYRKKADMLLLYIVNRDSRGLIRNIISSLYNFLHMIAFREYLLYVTSPGIFNNKILKSINIQSKRFGVISELNIKMYFKSNAVIQIPLFIENGTEGSNSVKMINIFESFRSFFNLLVEFYITRKINSKNSISFIKI